MSLTVSPHHTGDQIDAVLSKKAADLTGDDLAFLSEARSRLAAQSGGTPLRETFQFEEPVEAVAEVEPEPEVEPEHHKKRTHK